MAQGLLTLRLVVCGVGGTGGLEKKTQQGEGGSVELESIIEAGNTVVGHTLMGQGGALSHTPRKEIAQWLKRRV